jgi:hypothetical protein
MENHSRYPEELESRLDDLFARYRRLTPDPDPSPNFMPQLWQKIESSQSVLMSFRRWTQGLVATAATVCLLMVLYLSSPMSQVSPVYTATYLDALSAADHSPERIDLTEVGYRETGDRIP